MLLMFCFSVKDQYPAGAFSSLSNENHPMIYSPSSHPGVYDFLLSDEYNRGYINKYPGSFKFYNSSGLQPTD